MRFDDVLVRIKPARDEAKAIAVEIQKFLKQVSARLKPYKAKAVLGGSFAKDTWLKGDYDVDVFVTFPLSAKGKDLSAMLGKALQPWKPERIHGSRDYYWVRDGIRYEIIPVLAIRKASDAENVTDFSPQHVQWAVKRLKGLHDDVRLAKQFCKAQKVYGAESYIRGLSGHVLDLLVIHYKGFRNLLRAAAKWKPKTVIDIPNAHKGKALLVLNQSKTQGPLVVVDPVQPDRNAAAAMTLERYDRFVQAAKEFNKKPGEHFFEPKRPDFGALSEKGTLIRIRVKTIDAKEDVAGTKLVQAYEHIKRALEPFGIIESDWEWDRLSDGLLWYVIREKELPATIEHPGPPLNMKDAVKRFRKAHKKTFTSGKRVYAAIPREHRTPENAVKAALDDNRVKERVKTAALQ